MYRQSFMADTDAITGGKKPCAALLIVRSSAFLFTWAVALMRSLSLGHLLVAIRGVFYSFSPTHFVISIPS